jgi:hypothetical protein
MPSPALGQTESLVETLTRLRQDLRLYAQACLIIRKKSSAFSPLVFNEAQRIVHEQLSTQLKTTGRIRAVILKARQEGVSTLVAARFFRAIHLWPGIVALVIADSLTRAGALYDIYDRYYNNLPPELKPVRTRRANQRSVKFSHDSELSVRPATDTEAGRAITVHRVHASELAYWGDQADETWISLMQSVPDQGSEVIVESTAKGAGGLFHRLWEDAEAGESGWIAIFLPWWIHEEYEREPDAEIVDAITKEPDDFEKQALEEGFQYRGKTHILTLPKLAWRRATIVEKFGGDPRHPSKDAIRQFQQEYPATAEEAFLVSGACFFDEDRLRSLARRGEDPETRGRLVRRDDRSVGIDPNIRGPFRAWNPPEIGRHYVVGADTAEGIEKAKERSSIENEVGGRDYSAAVVLRLPYRDGDVQHPAKVVAELHGHLAPEVFAEQLRLLGEMYSCGESKAGEYRSKALVAVERSHSSGQTVLRLLNESFNYHPLFWHREINRRTRKIGRRVGWITDVTSRMPMLDDLGRAIREDKIEIRGKDLLREMTTFVFWPNGKPMAEEGCHDDRVIALGIAWQMASREHSHGGRDLPRPYEPDPDSQTGY